MAGPRRILLVSNPNSSGGGASLRSVLDMWSQAGITVEHVSCDRASSLSPIIIARAGESDIVAIAGGDGTMNAAAQGLMASQKPLGILPTGTANDLARTFAIPTDLDRAAQIIMSGHERRIDLGKPMAICSSTSLALAWPLIWPKA